MNRSNRRDFLKTAAVAGVGATFTILPRYVVGKPGLTPPSRKLNIAAIGVGGRGVWDLRHIHRKEHNFVAWADVDETKARKDVLKFEDDFPAFEKIPSFTDYRVMLDKMGKDIDAVMIATPDHSHLHAAATALMHGKHVYLEKPLCHDIAACRKLAAMAAERPELATQMGNQGNSSMSRDQMEYWIEQGAIGRPVESYAWTCASMASDSPLEPVPPPDTLDYNLWTNRAQERPFAKGFHPFHWRKWRWFGSGMLGDWGCHQLNSAFYLLKLADRPARVTVEPGGDWVAPNSYPLRQTTTWHYPAHGDLPATKLTYYVYREQASQPDIVPWPEHLEEEYRQPSRCGGVIVGSDASLMFDGYGQGARIIPRVKAKEIGKPPRLPGRSKGGHYKNWFDACMGEQQTVSPFAYGAGLTEMLLLSEAALRSEGKVIEWDPVAMKVTNDSSPLVREVVEGPPTRTGWEV